MQDIIVVTVPLLNGKSSTPKVVHDKDKGFLRLSEMKLSLSLADLLSHAPLLTES